MAAQMALEEVVARQAENVALLYRLRHQSVRAPDLTLTDLARVDQRIESHLEHLSLAADAAWAVCGDAIQTGEAEDLFAAAALALRTRNAEKLEEVIACAEQHAHGAEGVAAALAWTPAPHLKGTVKSLLQSDSPLRRYLGLAACVAHRVRPIAQLSAALADEAVQVRALALRACGELGATELLSTVLAALNDPVLACRYSALWSAVVLENDLSKAEHLAYLAGNSVLPDEFAFETALAALPVSTATAILAELLRDPAKLRRVVIGVGVVGSPRHVPWLIDQMRLDSVSRVAGHSMSVMCGISLTHARLERLPVQQRVGEEGDEELMACDEDLPWPDVDKARAWWETAHGHFSVERRYFAGHDVSHDACVTVLSRGWLRHRQAAALHLALMTPGVPLFNTAAPAWRQRRWLGNIS